MKKIWKASLASVCAAAMLTSSLLSTAGEKKSVKAAVGADMWTTYNSFIVLQDNEDMEGGNLISPKKLSQGDELRQKGLNVDMFRGETEGAQLIVTPETRVNEYTVSVSDLVNVGDSEKKIEKENVEIFKQHYAYVGNNSAEGWNLHFATGYYPDVMIPIDGVIKNNENFIEAGKNQGFTFEVTVSADEEKYPAGTYRGTISLTMDGAVEEIPLVVRVRDITIEKSYMISTAASANSLDRAAYEMCLDYHVIPQFMPHAASSPEAFVRELRRYWDDPDFTNYEIPNYFGSGYFYKFAYAIAEACIEDGINYFERAIMYMQQVDEPHSGEYASSQIAGHHAQKASVIGALKTKYSNDADALAIISEWLQDAVNNIPFIIANDIWVVTIRAEDFDTVNQAISFANNGGRWRGEELAHEYRQVIGDLPILTYNNGGIITMGMSLPALGSSMRNLGWACSQYDIDGHLWWDIDSAMLFNPPGDANGYWTSDYYDDLNAFSNSYGHARLITPAKKYGNPDEWLPTLRLRNFRDGVDDFDLLYTLEKLYNDGLLAEHGIEAYDFDALMEWVYTQGLSSGYVYVPDDGHIVEEMRTIVMDLIELAQSDVKYVNGGVAFNGTKATFSFYADADKVTVNGETVSGLNNRYDYTIANINTTPRVNVVIEKDGKTYNFSAAVFEFGELKSAFDVNGMTAANVTNFVASSPAGGIASTDVPAGTVTFDQASKKVTFNIQSAYGYDVIQSMDYVPQFTLNETFFGVDNIFDLYYVSMKIRIKFTNPPVRSSDQQAVDFVPLYLSYVSGYSSTTFGNFIFDYVEDGWCERTIVFKIDRAAISDATSINFCFMSYHSDMFNMGATVEISDVYFTLYQHQVQ